MRLVALPVLLAVWSSTVQAAEPEVDSVDYARPDKYLELPASLGSSAAIRKKAATLKSQADLDTVHNILDWMDEYLKYDARKAYSWRDYDDVVRERAYGGCADQAIVCGALLRAAGIPAVWVKTMDVTWIWDFKKGRPFQAWSGHVFLEIHVKGKWSLLDPGAKTVYEEYDPRARILPGNRFAYHKGSDPKAMVMSLQWDEWKRQTEAYFKNLDETFLPVDERSGTSLVPQVYIIGNSPYYQALTQMAADSGMKPVVSFNTDYDRYLPQARGHIILIETHGGRPIVPKPILEKYYPNAMAGVTRRSMSIEVDGTRLVFVDFSELLQALRPLETSKADEPGSTSGN